MQFYFYERKKRTGNIFLILVDEPVFLILSRAELNLEIDETEIYFDKFMEYV